MTREAKASEGIFGQHVTGTDINAPIRVHLLADLADKVNTPPSITPDELDPGFYNAAILKGNRTLASFNNLSREEIATTINRSGHYETGVDVYVQKVPESDRYTRQLDFTP